MKLGWGEWLLMHNPVRGMIQRYFEAHQLRCLGGTRPGALALEIGCGSGTGIDVLRDLFEVGQVDAFDLDARAVHLAAARHRSRPGSPSLWVGNVRHIPVGDDRYDAVFDFGILHHVVDWPAALAQIHRVLKPGGRFYIEEIPHQVIVHPVLQRILDHPIHPSHRYTLY